MPVRNRYIILSALLWLASSLCTFAQVTSLSDAQIPCDKVFAVHGDVAIGADHWSSIYRNLTTFDLQTGEIIHNHDKIVHKAIEQGGIHYFLLSETTINAHKSLYLFENGQLQAAPFSASLSDIQIIPELNALAGFQSEGMVVMQDGIVLAEVALGSRPLSIQAHGEGFLAITKHNYFFIDDGLNITEEHELPEGLESFVGAESDGVLLLSPFTPPHADRSLHVYNTATEELISVTDSSGEPVLINHFVIPLGALDHHFFLAGNGQITDLPFSMTHPTDAGFVNTATGLYIESNSRIGLRKGVVQPAMFEGSKGSLVFGRFGIEGVEPYAIHNQKIEVLKDIYEGFGGSIDLLLQNALNSNPLSRPPAFELVAHDGIVYFSAHSTDLGHQVWRSDGSAEGTYAITDFNLSDKGYRKCFMSKNGEDVLLTVAHYNGSKQLYMLDLHAPPIHIESDKAQNWEQVFATHPIIQSGTFYIDRYPLGAHVAHDGSSALIIKRMGAFHDYIAFNEHWVLPRVHDQHFDANTAVQIFAADGSLLSSTLVRAREDQNRATGRSYSSGHVYMAVSHRPFDTYVNDVLINEPREGHHLIEFDASGELVKFTFLPTGGKDDILITELKITDEGIYLLGMAERNFSMGGAYVNTIAQNQVRGVLVKYTLNHELLWIADTDVDQAIFGDGLQHLHVGEQSVYTATGGTAYNVWSSCANRNWPYYISSFDKETGNRNWRKALESDDVTRITGMQETGGQWLWLGGYTRGNLSLADKELPLVSNFMNCGYNGYMLSLNAGSGATMFLQHSDPSRAKFIQDMQVHDGHLYTLAMVYEEEVFPSPIFAQDGRWNLQFDKWTNGGIHVDSLIWPTSIPRSDLQRRLERIRFSFDFHPQEGVVVSGLEITNGTIGGFTAPSTETSSSMPKNSWMMMRRDIDALLQATLPPQPLDAEQMDFDIFPNPLSSSALTLVIPAADSDKYDQIVFTDMHGRRCLQQNLTGPFESRLVEVDGNLANGVYIVELVGTSRSAAKKLLLQR